MWANCRLVLANACSPMQDQFLFQFVDGPFLTDWNFLRSGIVEIRGTRTRPCDDGNLRAE